MNASSVLGFIMGAGLMIFGYGWRKKGYEISGDLAISIGLLGILIVIFYSKIYYLLNKLCSILSIGPFITTTNSINPYFIIFASSIFVLLVLCITFLSSVFIPVKKSNSNKKIKSLLFSEIDHNLKLLQNFWDKLWGCLETAPISIAQGFEKIQQIVINENQPHTKRVVTMHTDLHSTNSPCWHRKQFDKPTSLDDLLVDEQQSIRQFYDNLEDITSMYEKLRDYKATSLIAKCESGLKILIKTMLTQGNPLKTPNQSLHQTPEAVAV